MSTSHPQERSRPDQQVTGSSLAVAEALGSSPRDTSSSRRSSSGGIEAAEVEAPSALQATTTSSTLATAVSSNYYHPHRHPKDVNFRILFQEFDASKFLVFTCLLIFAILFSLRMDGVIMWSWWAVFTPLWIWKLVVISGALVGSYVWWRRPHNRLNSEEYIQYKAMLISLATQLLLLMFELLVADNLELNRRLWLIVFLPLIFISIISIAICIWSVRHDRSFELELFCAVNILQFIFLSFKLDNLIAWPWEITFVPIWIMLCISLVGVLYTIIFAGIILRRPEVNVEQRRNSTHSALGHSCLVIPLLVFLVLLTNKLDGSIRISYFAAFSPLFLTFFTLVVTSFGSRGGNPYWFGLRKSPCQFLFGVCPCLQLFGNISYSLYSNRATSTSSSSSRPTATEVFDDDGVSEDAARSSDFTNHSGVGGGDLGQSQINLELVSEIRKLQQKKSKKNVSVSTSASTDPIIVPALSLDLPD